jgi:RNA polymerase sigma-70 factor (ECF subfamily)
MDAQTVNLIVHAQQGSADAVAELYRRYADQIMRYVAYRVGDSHMAEDLVSEVFLTMLERLPDYQIRADKPFEAWLYGIARRRVADYFRRMQGRLRHPIPDTWDDTMKSAEQWVIENDEFIALSRALSHLSEEHQTILILRFVEQKTHEEVALVLGKTPTAIMTAQYRALKQLARWLGQDQHAGFYLRGKQE